MKPYYEHAGITIYHGDCRELIDVLPKSCSIVSDPPYGCDMQPTWSKSPKNYTPVYGDSTPFNPWPWVSFPRCILFGANHFAPKLPPSPTWIVWDKRCGLGENDNADCELAWVKNAEIGRAHV